MKVHYVYFTEEESFEYGAEQEHVPRIGEKILGMGGLFELEEWMPLEVEDVMWYWDEKRAAVSFVLVTLQKAQVGVDEERLMKLVPVDNTTPFD